MGRTDHVISEHFSEFLRNRRLYKNKTYSNFLCDWINFKFIVSMNDSHEQLNQSMVMIANSEPNNTIEGTAAD